MLIIYFLFTRVREQTGMWTSVLQGDLKPRKYLFVSQILDFCACMYSDVDVCGTICNCLPFATSIDHGLNRKWYFIGVDLLDVRTRCIYELNSVQSFGMITATPILRCRSSCHMFSSPFVSRTFIIFNHIVLLIHFIGFAELGNLSFDGRWIMLWLMIEGYMWILVKVSQSFGTNSDEEITKLVKVIV